MNRIYQWLSGRASFFRSDTFGHGTSRTVRTEVTVQRQGTTLLVGGAAAAGFDICPLCGTKLAPAQANACLHKRSISQESLSVDGSGP